MDTSASQVFIEDLKHFLTEPNAFRSVIILIVALLIAYWASRFLALGVVKIAQIVATRSDNESNELRATRLRQTETYLSIAVAVIRMVVVAIVGYFAWRMLSPFAGASSAANGIAAIGDIFCPHRRTDRRHRPARPDRWRRHDHRGLVQNR